MDVLEIQEGTLSEHVRHERFFLIALIARVRAGGGGGGGEGDDSGTAVTPTPSDCSKHIVSKRSNGQTVRIKQQ